MDLNHSTSTLNALLGFFDLPKELRLKILEYTDLVCDPKRYHAKDFEVHLDGSRGEEMICLSKFGNVCKTTPICDCFHFPGALFAVSRQMHIEAYETLFYKNRIVINGSSAEMLKILRRLKPEIRHSIRNLDFEIREIQPPT